MASNEQNRFQIGLINFAVLAGVVLGFHQLLWHWDAAWLFTKDDNLTQNLTLIKAQTDVLLGFEIPRMIWGLGAGWDPFMSGQMGLFYPPYLVANIITRLLGAPLALLEVSYVLHQILLVGVVLSLASGEQKDKSLLALCLVFLPGPFLLGMNWHAYGVAHVWWVAAALIISAEARKPKPFERPLHKVSLWACTVLFYQCAHPQVFIWGLMFLAAWAWVISPRRHQIKLLVLLALCVLPLAPSLLYLKWLSTQAGALSVRPDNLILEMAQPLPLAFWGSLIGNLGQILEMNFFTPTVYRDGPGLFFQPALVLCTLLALKQKRGVLVCVSLISWLLLGAKSFPFLGDLNLGPLNSFRWPFKLVVLTGPFFLLALCQLLAHKQKLRRPILGLIGLMSVCVCAQGRSFDLMTETYQQGINANELLKQTEQCLEQAGIPKGARIAYVGDYDKRPNEQSKTLTVLTGNAIHLLNRNATHINEPMEPDYLADGHLRAAGRQGNPLTARLFLEQGPELLKALAYVGATHVFTGQPNLFKNLNATECQDAEGQQVTFHALANARTGPYPQAHDPKSKNQVSSRINGVLVFPAVEERPPSLNTTAPISWQKEGNDWIGSPNPIQPLWGLAVALLAILVGWLFFKGRPFG